MNYSNLIKVRIRRKPGIQVVLKKLDKALKFYFKISISPLRIFVIILGFMCL